MPSDSTTLRSLLEQIRTIAVVGLSPDEGRASHEVARYLQTHGYRIVPVNPRCAEVLGEPCFARLEDIPFSVDLVDVFRRTEEVVPIARSAVAIGALGLWQQLGVVSAQADAHTQQAQRQLNHEGQHGASENGASGNAFCYGRDCRAGM